ncbi:hypothetical protein GA0070622_6431 [Micromonospora sediminicola]|uniref:Uncharacterized protein n=1 Tax=Micromonospora sediminicola TaxID=946078 RepID=A0A1A9BJQ0_9ACTN|nr:hypothetical protein [Micromonospora sediminicola]SBT69306.1 hypothetical protein GA0070622_6431 [Micromonospora sediminicola]
MSRLDDAQAALNNRDWSTAEIDTTPPRNDATVGHTVSMSLQLTERLFAEAQRRGITPPDLIREYVEHGLDAVDAVSPPPPSQ